jgi:alpha-tubulin suppressor-like RCC1 family protein
LWHWGKAENGQDTCWRGTGPAYSPERIPEPCNLSPVHVATLAPVAQAVLYEQRSLIVTRDGRAWENYLQPRAVPGLPPIIAAAVGVEHSVVLAADGTLWSWGANDFGQLGVLTAEHCMTSRGSIPCSVAPVKIAGLTRVRAIAAGRDHTLALTETGTVWAWGVNYSGQVGADSNNRCSARVPDQPAYECARTPVQVISLDGVRLIAAGDSHSLALKEDGSVWVWGSNVYRQLGTSTIERCTNGIPCRRSPTAVAGINNTRVITAGGIRSLAIQVDGSVWSWGHIDPDESGPRVDDIALQSTTPRLISTVRDIVTATPGASHNLALTADGSVWAWGLNNYGQIGVGRQN